MYVKSKLINGYLGLLNNKNSRAPPPGPQPGGSKFCMRFSQIYRMHIIITAIQTLKRGAISASCLGRHDP